MPLEIYDHGVYNEGDEDKFVKYHTPLDNGIALYLYSSCRNFLLFI